MKRSIRLSDEDLKEAIREWCVKKAGFTPKYVSIHFEKGDRPFDADTWTARADE